MTAEVSVYRSEGKTCVKMRHAKGEHHFSTVAPMEAVYKVLSGVGAGLATRKRRADARLSALKAADFSQYEKFYEEMKASQ